MAFKRIQKEFITTNLKPDFSLRLHVNRYLQYIVVKLIDGTKNSDW